MSNDAISAIGSHEIEQFSHDGGMSLVGLLLAVIGSLLAAIGVGYLVSLTKPYFYVVMISPFVMGGLVGGACFCLVRICHLRHIIVAILLGLVSGTVCTLAPHYFDYLSTIQQAEQEMPGFRAQVVNKGKFTFVDYMHDAATRGVTIGEFGDRTLRNPRNLGYVGSFIYWFNELFWIVLIVTASSGIPAAGPYCRNCSRWKKDKIVAKLEGYEEAEAVELVNQGMLGTVLEKAVPSRRNNGLLHHLHLKLARCPKCGEEGTVVVTVLKNLPVGHSRNRVLALPLARVVYPSRIQRTLPAWVDP